MKLLWKKPKDYQYLFLDMNAYFASVEQQEHPELRGKPVAVTPTVCPTGCIITSSYEARKYKVKTGIMIKDALALCPQLIVRSSDTFLYLRYHNELINLIKNITPFYVVKSIDELYIKISTSEQTSNNSLVFANNIKNTINKRLGKYIKCSIGIASNIFLAKLSAEYEKPDGLTILKYDKIKQFLSYHKLTDLCGISFRMQKRLNKIGIFTPLDFYKKDIQTLKNQLGKAGEHWYLNLHGYSALTNENPEIPKTISQSHVLEPSLRSWHIAWPVCQKLIYKAASRLRKYHLCAKKATISIKYYGEGHWAKWLRIPKASDSFTLSRYIKYLWNLIPKEENFPLRVRIVFFELENSQRYQQRLFDHIQRQKYLCRSIDKINNNFGKNCINPANLMYVEQSAPERISFGNPNI